MTTNMEVRELSSDELDEVSGGFKVTFGSVTFEASSAHMGVAVTVEGKGGVSVTSSGVTVMDGKGNINSGSWGDIFGGGKK